MATSSRRAWSTVPNNTRDEVAVTTFTCLQRVVWRVPTSCVLVLALAWTFAPVVQTPSAFRRDAADTRRCCLIASVARARGPVCLAWHGKEFLASHEHRGHDLKDVHDRTELRNAMVPDPFDRARNAQQVGVLEEPRGDALRH
ncbi:hypothetical protein PsorP6_015446 [Peronosclerospora sorghi]|uniref:Uncharacterized protein n=1 Tax=Peronosclerospora sorghi TaxID=230839 RepID=A0ACC0WNT7_9STRA|nr:hypothetical protein PsorP6_015446 [Peronosclerospora sorghi]